MFREKSGASAISLILCGVIITLVTTALVVATLNSGINRAQMNEKQVNQMETLSYSKVYNIGEIRNIAKQSYVNNFISFYEGEVSLQEFKQLVLKDIMQAVPQEQLQEYVVNVTPDGVNVEYK